MVPKTKPGQTTSARSELMKRVKQRDTAAEISFRTALHAKGLRYFVNRRIEGVAVDIVFPKARVAVFVDGCFWHGCPKHASYPKTNKEYWLPKLQANRERDRRQSAKLRASGWNVKRVWEHDCLPASSRAISRVIKAVRTRSS